MVGVGATGRYAAATPADAASVLTEGARGDERVLVGVHRPGRCRTAQRGDVERVGRAVRLAHEAGLAVALAGDDRNPVRPAVEDVPGADLDAQVAGDARGGADDFDHDTAPTGSRAGPSGRTLTSSSPLTISRCCRAASAAGWSIRRCTPRDSVRASAAACTQRAFARTAAASRARSRSRPDPASPLRARSHTPSRATAEAASAGPVRSSVRSGGTMCSCTVRTTSAGRSGAAVPTGRRPMVPAGRTGPTRPADRACRAALAPAHVPEEIAQAPLWLPPPLMAPVTSSRVAASPAANRPGTAVSRSADTSPNPPVPRTVPSRRVSPNGRLFSGRLAGLQTGGGCSGSDCEDRPEHPPDRTLCLGRLIIWAAA